MAKHKYFPIALVPIILICSIFSLSSVTLAENPHFVEIDSGEETQRESQNEQAQFLEHVAQIGGVTQAIIIDGVRAYIGEGPRLTILDISNPADPYPIGKTDLLGGLVSDIVLSGQYAFVVTSGGGNLYVVSISDPTHPIIIGSLSTGGYAEGISVAGQYAYVATYSNGLYVVNLSNPSTPTLETVVNPEGYEVDVFVSESLLYLSSGAWNGLRILDISNPTSPIEIGSYRTTDWIYGIEVIGDYAYLADGGYGVIILDISNPASPKSAGWVWQIDAMDLKISWPYAYIAGYEDGLGIIDITNPTAPSFIGKLDTSGWAMSVDVSANYALLADYHGGLHSIEISQPENPNLVGTYPEPSYARNVAISGNYAFTCGLGGLRVLNISNPRNPVMIGHNLGIADGCGIDIQGIYGYIAAGSNGLQVVNIANPATPAIVGTINTPGTAMDIQVSGSHVYIADLERGLQIYNIANPTTPSLVSGYDTPGEARGLTISGDYLYLADLTGGLRIFNISNPLMPISLGIFDTPGRAVDVVVDGKYAYVADWERGLRIIDISIPSAPTEVGSFDTPGSAFGITFDGDFLFVADSTGIYAFNVSDPTNPDVIDVAYTSGSPQHVETYGGFLFVATGAAGLTIFEYPIVDLSVDEMTINQVFLLDPSIGTDTLVANKPSMARIFVNINGNIPNSEIPTELTLSNNAGDTISIGPENKPSFTTTDPDFNQSINLLLPPAWLSGTITMTAIVDPDQMFIETNESNNTKQNDFTFHNPENDLRINYAQIPYIDYEQDMIYLADPQRLFFQDELLRKIYPLGLSDVVMQFQGISPILIPNKFDGTTGWNQYLPSLNLYWNWLSITSGWRDGIEPDRLFGWIPNQARHLERDCKTNNCECGIADSLWNSELGRRGLGVVAVGSDYCDKPNEIEYKPENIFAHEIGHLLNENGLGHTPNGPYAEDNNCIEAIPGDPGYPSYPPFPLGSIGVKGLDLISGEIYYPQRTYDFMSYCYPHWISPYNYQKLFDEYYPPSPLISQATTINEAQRVIIVSGLVYTPTLSVDFYPSYVMTTTMSLPPDTGSSYCVEIQDSSSILLAERCFHLGFVEAEGGIPIPEDAFSVVVPYPTNANRVVLKHFDTVIGELQASPQPPIISLMYPNGGELWQTGGVYAATWSASDLDDDPLSYAVEYSQDGGVTWVPISINITTTQLIISSDQLPGGNNSLLRVSVTDGINTAVDISDAVFTVAKKAPSVEIISPSDGAVIPTNTSFYLSGNAYDLENGTLDNSHLSWYSDQDGFLGNGKLILVSLTPGNHIITLEGVDYDGNNSNDFIEIFVGYKLHMPILTKFQLVE